MNSLLWLCANNPGHSFFESSGILMGRCIMEENEFHPPGVIDLLDFVGFCWICWLSWCWWLSWLCYCCFVGFVGTVFNYRSIPRLFRPPIIHFRRVNGSILIFIFISGTVKRLQEAAGEAEIDSRSIGDPFCSIIL